MFVCSHCSKAIAPKSPSFLVPTKLRKRIYPLRIGANTFLDSSKPGKRRLIVKNDRGGQGHEIVREARVCGACKRDAPAPSIV